jgi:hypothetical protein
VQLSRRIVSPGNALTLLAGGHALWGLLAYREPLREIGRAGVADAVGDGLFNTEHSADARAAAFWFMAITPLLAVIGQLVESADRAGDRPALVTSAGVTLGMGLAGAVVIPRSGFPAALPIGVWLLRRARRARK